MRISPRTAATVAMLATILSGACGSKAAAQRTCRQSAGAEVCLVEADTAYKLEGSGLRPRSELLVAMDGDERAMSLTADGGGSVPDEAGVAGFLPGPTAQHVTVTGRSVTGTEVRFEFEIPAVSR